MKEHSYKIELLHEMKIEEKLVSVIEHGNFKIKLCDFYSKLQLVVKIKAKVLDFNIL